jgi:ubiquitin-protein ligase
MNSVANKRKERDLMKLMMSNFDVHLTDENNRNDLFVIFKGPKDSPYENVNFLKKILI